MAKFNFNLRTGRGSDPDRPAVVRFLIRWGGRTLTYPTGETIAPRHWCHTPGQRNYQRAKETRAFPEHPEFNDRLNALLATAKATFRNFVTDNGREPEPEELREALNLATGRTEQRRVDLLAFVAAFVESEEGKFNTDRKRPFHRATVSRYRVTLELLREYVAARTKGSASRSVPFPSIDPEFVAGFTVFLTTAKGYAANTVVKYGRSLRLFLRRAKEAGHEVSDNVFSRRLALKEDPSDQVYLNPEELAALYRLDLTGRPGLERARDLFIVGAWTGLRFGDLSRLQPEHVEGDRIRIPTAKTGREVWIPLHPFVRAIMAKYGGRVPVAVSNQKQNEHLKALAALVPELRTRVMVARTVGGVRREAAREKWELVTTHTARRSFASNLYRNGVPARTIMGVTGHTTEQSFMRYIRLSNEEHAEILAASPLFQLAPLKAV
jgi:integrase